MYDELKDALGNIKNIVGHTTGNNDTDILTIEMSGKLHSWLMGVALAGPAPELPEDLPGEAYAIATWAVTMLPVGHDFKDLLVAVLVVNDYADKGDWLAAQRLAAVRWLIEYQDTVGLDTVNMGMAIKWVMSEEPLYTTAQEGWAGAWLA